MTTQPTTALALAPEWEGPPRFAAIIQAVLGVLGPPDDFVRATIREVRDNTFRVNVVTGPDPSAIRIAHSYFLTADADGRVTGSEPALVRCY